jgi:hypothetical protein
MAQLNQQSPEPQKKGYGKRPMWQWVLLYVIIAVIVYGAVYLIFFHHSGGTSGGVNY